MKLINTYSKKQIMPEFYVPIDYHNDNNTRKYTLKYYKNQIIICKTHHQSKAAQLYVNFQYKIENTNNKTIGLKMISNKESNEMVFETSILKFFSLPYCSTCHSVQGATIKEDFYNFSC